MLRTHLFFSILGLSCAGALAAEPPGVKPGWTLLPDQVAEAKIEEIVTEDDRARIEELRVRGEVKRVMVRLKNSVMPDYEILLSDAQYELRPGLSHGVRRGVTGTRVWRVLDF
jgi:hypothetical protein